MLYICPTPIGNLGDVTLRALEVLKSVDLVACEDTRRTRILLDRYGVNARLLSFHGHNEQQRVETLLPRLREGEDIALVSDAGMPGLSDPGFVLVRACAAEGLPVTVLPGPSAIDTALVLSGLPCDRFAFVGFLPRARQKLLGALGRFEGTGAALVAFESPRRIRGALGVIAERWPDRQVAVCRELTKIHEEVIRGTAAEVVAKLAEPMRGEIVLVLEPSGTGPAGEEAVSAGGADARRDAGPGGEGVDSPVSVMEERALEALVELALAGVKTKKASAIVASLTGLPARRAYELALLSRVRPDGCG
jgi:16S rRNA (cytidine1402-2'-O)-methyltransferase